MAKVVIIDNDTTTHATLGVWLGSEHSVITYEHGTLAVDFVREQRPDLVFLNLELQDTNPFEMISLLSNRSSSPRVVGLISRQSARSIVEAVRSGATDVVAKPLTRERVAHAIATALARTGKNAGTQLLAGVPELVGVSQGISTIRRLIHRYADSSAPVLILGESGVGKELVASAVHRLSGVLHGRFVAINCAAVPDTLFESEMFGTQSGAYTDARARVGAFEYAHRGTIFLDEIGELSQAAQAKLLRVLETGQFHRMGETEERFSSARIVAATNVELTEQVAAGRFREDLYYRLNVARIRVPALRERREDIPILASHFCELLTHREKRSGSPYLTHGALDLLAGHDWPGNIRELKNVVWRAMLLASGDRIGPESIEFDS